MVIVGLSTSIRADEAYSVINTSADLYVKAGTKFYNIPDASGAVVYTSFADGNIPVNGVCAVDVGGVRYSFDPQGNPGAYPLATGNDAGAGYLCSGVDKFSMLEKIAPNQKSLIDLAFSKWKK